MALFGLVTACQFLPARRQDAPRLEPYRPPTITLAHPLPGGPVSADRPIIVFRFVAGEASDPIDVSTLAITVDGRDRTTRFQLSAAEAWGPVIDMASSATAPSGAPAPRVEARVCSVRGVCASTSATVVLVTSRL
jgi:hypothetical protein